MIDAVTATRQDLQHGLATAFTITSTINTSSPVNENLLQNDTYAAVVWSLSARHTGPFCGIAATQREVVIEGLTVVALPQKDSDKPQFMRFIDWSVVLGQLGVVTNGRSLTLT